MPNITFSAPGDGREAAELPGHLAVPEGDGPWPGVVVLQEAFGLNDDIRAQADRLAAEGYLALAPDLYSRGPRMRCTMQAFRDLFARSGRTFADIEAARSWLAGRQDCTGRVGAIGFCMGGGFALVAAAKYDFAAASVNYGAVPRKPAEVLQGACPIVASYGGADRAMRGAAGKLERALAELDVPHDVKEYPGAGHGFLGRHTPPRPLDSLVKITMRYGYAEPAADDAWARILAFFGEHVSGSEKKSTT
jgi:carboxymethylenebutenolidase